MPLHSSAGETSKRRISPESVHERDVGVVAPDRQTFFREAIVPIDHDAESGSPRLLFDYELNALVRKIVARTRSVTLVLDCCFSSSVVRGLGDLPEEMSRCIDLDRGAPLLDPGKGRPIPDGMQRTQLGAADDCHVVAACLGHERAKEARGDDG